LAPHRKGRTHTESVRERVAEPSVWAQEEGSNSAKWHFVTYRHYHVLLGWADDVAWDKQDMIVVAGQYQNSF